MSDIDDLCTVTERLHSLIEAGHAVTINKADDGCYEASITAGELTETAHAATLGAALLDLCETYVERWEPTT